MEKHILCGNSINLDRIGGIRTTIHEKQTARKRGNSGKIREIISEYEDLMVKTIKPPPENINHNRG